MEEQEDFEERFRGLRERWKNRKIQEQIEKQGENQNEYIIKMDQRFSAGT